MCCVQVTSNEVSARVAQAEATEREIDDTREQYRPVASHASLLFFAISELAAIDPMYQYSLGWFLALFGKAMEEAPKVGSGMAGCARKPAIGRPVCAGGCAVFSGRLYDTRDVLATTGEPPFCVDVLCRHQPL